MKKNNLFKVIGITILVAVLLTWIFKGSYYSGSLEIVDRFQVGLFDLFQYLIDTFSYFISNFLYLIVIGAMYGVLHATKVYPKLVKGIADGFKGREWLFLAITISLLAIVASVTGFDFGLIILFPFLISVILKMGYDKTTAVAATAGSIMIGMYGATFSSTMYGTSNSVLSLGYSSEIWTKLVLLLLGLVLLISFVIIRGNKTKKEVKEENVEYSKKSIWPMVILLDLMLIVIIMGTISWSTVFNITIFEKFHDLVMNFSVGGFKIFAKVLSGGNYVGSSSISAFGGWSYDVSMIIIILTTIALGLIYRVKFNDFLKACVNGIKDMLVPALLTTIVYTLLIIAVYNPTGLTIANAIMKITDGFNVITSAITFMISSVLHVDMYYASQQILPYVSSVITDVELYPLINVMFTNLYGLMMLIAPSSVILVATLAYTKTSYTEWIKYIWKAFLILLVISLLVFITVLVI